MPLVCSIHRKVFAVTEILRRRIMAPKNENTDALHQIVIVGGGAGGLGLATRLGDTLGKQRKAIVTLVDKSRTHLWKPLLHQVAAGSLGIEDHALDYMAQARWHHFEFRLGAMEDLNRTLKEIYLTPVYDEKGKLLIPRRVLKYDTLIIAVGSVSNDFKVPGVTEHCITLDTHAAAAVLHRQLINSCIRAQVQETELQPGQLHIVIVGGGATGIELAAELHGSTRELTAYGLNRINPDRDIKLTIIESAPRVLPSLPEEMALIVQRQLTDLNISLELGETVTKVGENVVYTQNGRSIDAELIVWAAGIKAPDCLKNVDGLETNGINQLVVRPTLQTTLDDNIFALGDCAACPIPGGQKESFVPPRAQAAQQQASLLIKSIHCRLKQKPLPEYRYKDFGSLMTLGKFTAVGKLMGGLSGEEVFVQGEIAGFMFRALYKLHLYTLHGITRVLLDTIAGMITRRNESHVKLH